MQIKVLDHGYVELVEMWGMGRSGAPENEWDGTKPDFETGVIEAARQSTQSSFRGWEEDSKLLTYLYKNKHLTPFEQAGMTIEVQAPIFVFREWHRHRTQSYNEMSARYAPLPDLYYLPSLENVRSRLGPQANKQAAAISDESLTDAEIDDWRKAVAAFQKQSEYIYQKALAGGIPKELARIVMPVGHYSRMRASANLRNWLQFLTLRLAPAAQYEIREYAKAVGQIVAETFPQTWELFNEFPL